MTLLKTISALLAQEGSDKSLLDTIQEGGIIGYIIIALSVVAMCFIVLHLIQIRRNALLPPTHVDEVDRLLARGDVNGAVAYCADPNNDSYFTRIMTAGLMRFTKSAFGVFEIKNAIQEAGEEETARLYRSTDVLSVIGAISPLLGLTGTVLGIVGAFETLSAGASPDHKALAADISLALVATLLGLIVAIPCMALFTYFRNRVDALAAVAGMEIDRILLHLETPAMQAAPPRPMPARPMQPVAAGSRGG